MRAAVDLAWLAGILEGEGSFQIMKARPIVRRRAFGAERTTFSSPLPKIILRMTDRDVVARVSELFGVGTVTVSGRTQTRKTVYHCAVAGANAAGWMMTLYLRLGQRRRSQIRRALASWQTGKTHRYHVTRAWNQASDRAERLSRQMETGVWV